jgi:hypothetical protein
MANSSYTLRNMGNYSQWWDMAMISGICITRQSEKTSPQKNSTVPSTIMHTTLENYWEFPIYTNYEGDDVDHGDGCRAIVGDGEDGDGNDPPYAEEVLVSMMMVISPSRRQRDSRISPLLKKEKSSWSAAASENYRKIWRRFFLWGEDFRKKEERRAMGLLGPTIACLHFMGVSWDPSRPPWLLPWASKAGWLRPFEKLACYFFSIYLEYKKSLKQ